MATKKAVPAPAEPENEQKTLFVEFAPGLVVEMKLPSEEAAAVAYATLRAATRDDAKFARAIEVYFKFIARMLVDPGDEDRLADALLDGVLTFDQISEGVESLAGGLSGDKAKPAPVKRTRRAR